MSSPKVLFGFHAVGVRLKTAPKSVIEIYYEVTRRDARMRQFLDRAREAGARLIEADSERNAKLAGSHGHQGVAARVEPVAQITSLDELLENLEAAGVENPLLLVLDGVTDPHNLGACLRVADGAGAHAVIAPKDHAVGINATVAKVASGAAETMPYFMVTNLARTLNELKERGIWVIGTDTSRSQVSRVSRRMPSPSEPITSAAPPLKSASYRPLSASSVVPISQISRSFSSRMVRARLVTVM